MSIHARHVAVCSFGNTHYGDEGVGPAALAELRKDVTGDVLFVDCVSSPGRMIQRVFDYSPRKVLIITALEMGRGAGAVENPDADEAKKLLLSSHKVEEEMFIRYLQNSTDAEIAVIGVQPKSIEQGDGTSPECRNALVLVTDMAGQLLGA